MNIMSRTNSLKIVFASHREYSIKNDVLYTNGSLGAETGENFREIFPNFKLIGRENLKSVATTQVKTNSYYLVKFNLRSPMILINFFSLLVKLYRTVLESDAVLVRAGGLGTLVAIIGIFQRKPVGIEVGGCVFNSLWNYGSFLGKLAAPFSYLLRCILFRMADRVQLVTQNYLQKRYFINTNKVRCIGISNVSIERHDTSILHERIDRDLMSKEIILGSIGSFNGTFKGHDQAIKALSQLLDKGYNIKLRILGGGDKAPLKSQIKNLGLEQKVQLFDPINPGKDVENWLSKIDIYCQFSRREGISRALLEAMNLGLPVVATNAGGTYEIVDRKSLFEIDDVNKSITIIEDMIIDADFYREMCKLSFNTTARFQKRSLANKRKEFWSDFGN